MLQKRTFRHFRQANMSNRPSTPPNNIIQRTRIRAVWRRRESEPLVHCAACNTKRSLQQRNYEKRTFQTMETKLNESRIMLRERPLGQESQLKMQRQRFRRSRKIMLEMVVGAVRKSKSDIVVSTLAVTLYTE
jgi:hypothetical protein